MRKARILQSNAKYHVIAKANRGELIFEENEIKELFLSVLKESKKKYKFKVINFCIMNNHIHLILEPVNDESLSKIMQWILSVFAIRFNKIFRYIGHVFYDRFKSVIIDDINQLINTFKYIAENPVKANLSEKSVDYFYNGVRFLKLKIYDILEPPLPFLSHLF